MSEPKPWVVDPDAVVEYELLTPPTLVSSLVSNDLVYFWMFGPRPTGTPVYLKENWIKHEPALKGES